MNKSIETYPKNFINYEKNKKLQEVLWKKETQELYKSNYEKYKKLEEKINILTETQTELLDFKRELLWNTEEKADKLLKIIEKKENSPEYKVSKEIKANKDAVIKKMKEQAEEKVPIIWWFLFDIVNSDFFKKTDGILWSILKYIKTGILSWLWIENFKEQLEKTKLNKEQIKETKEKITNYLVENLKLNWKEEDIKKILNNEKIFTPEKLVEYYKKIQSWNWFSPNDLIKDFWSIWNIKEVLKNKLKDIDKKALNKISEYIYKNYWKILDKWQINNLKEIINKYITNWKISSDKLNEILKKKSFKIADLYPLLWDWVMFMLELVWKWIIDITDIWWNFVSEGWDIINLTIWRFWFSNSISTDSLIEKINWLKEEEKVWLLALLYRKWWMIFNIMWKLSWISSQLLLDTVLPSNTKIDWFKLFTDWILKWPEQQIKNIFKLEAAIKWTKVNTEAEKEIFNWVRKTFREIQYNYKLINLIDLNIKNKTIDSEKIKAVKNAINNVSDSGFKKYSHNLINNNSNTLDFNEFKKEIAQKIVSVKHVQKAWINWTTTKRTKEILVWFWKDAMEQKLNRWLWKILENQKNILNWELKLWPLRKIADSIDLAKISNYTDRMVFEFRSKDDAKAFLKQMNVLAQKSPALIEWIFKKLPIIWIAWLAASSDWNFLEDLKEYSKALIPIVWPLYILWKAWLHYDENWLHIDNLEDAMVWGWLLTLDWFLLWKAIKTSISTKWMSLIKYAWRPIIEAYEIGKWSYEIWHYVYKTWKALGNPKTFFEKIKWFKIRPKWLWIIWAIIAWYITYEMLKEEGYEDVMWEYYKDWKYNMEKIKTDYKKMNLSEKKDFIRLLFTDEANDILKINISKDIEIISKDKTQLNWDWFIDNKRRILFEEIIWKKIIFKYN